MNTYISSSIDRLAAREKVSAHVAGGSTATIASLITVKQHGNSPPVADELNLLDSVTAAT
jgi:hypothetical protein